MNFDYVTNTTIMKKQIEVLGENKTPLNHKGEPIQIIAYNVEDREILRSLLEALVGNTSFKGKLIIETNALDELLGYTLAKIISNNHLEHIEVNNRSNPLSDRVGVLMGDALEHNTTLKSLKVYIDVGNLSPLHLVKFVLNRNSKLSSFGYLKLNNQLLLHLEKYLSKECNLNSLYFYYDPLREVNLLYKFEIPNHTTSMLAEKIQSSSNLMEIDITPRYDFDEKVNVQMQKDVKCLEETFKFACDIVRNEEYDKINIDEIYHIQNQYVSEIIEKVDRSNMVNEKNSIISVRSYLQRTIGELLNRALYELEVQRERNPDMHEYFTAKGSIRYLAQYLVDNNI